LKNYIGYYFLTIKNYIGYDNASIVYFGIVKVKVFLKVFPLKLVDSTIKKKIAFTHIKPTFVKKNFL